jgi:hypothetical protein
VDSSAHARVAGSSRVGSAGRPRSRSMTRMMCWMVPVITVAQPAGKPSSSQSGASSDTSCPSAARAEATPPGAASGSASTGTPSGGRSATLTAVVAGGLCAVVLNGSAGAGRKW